MCGGISARATDKLASRRLTRTQVTDKLGSHGTDSHVGDTLQGTSRHGAMAPSCNEAMRGQTPRGQLRSANGSSIMQQHNGDGRDALVPVPKEAGRRQNPMLSR